MSALWITTVPPPPLHVLSNSFFRESLLQYLRRLWTSSLPATFLFSFTIIFSIIFHIFKFFLQPVSSSASSFKVGRTSKCRKNNLFLLLKAMSSGEFRISRRQADTMNFNTFPRRVHGQRFESASNLLNLAVDKADKRSEGSHFTYVFAAAKQKPLRELVKNQMRQIYSDSKIDPGARNCWILCCGNVSRSRWRTCNASLFYFREDPISHWSSAPVAGWRRLDDRFLELWKLHLQTICFVFPPSAFREPVRNQQKVDLNCAL